MDKSLDNDPGTTPISPIIEAFKKLRRVNAAGDEFWTAREIYRVFGYDKWDRFRDVIGRGIAGCEKHGVKTRNHFLSTGKMVEVGSGAQVRTADYFLSRVACYLIAMEGDARKPEIAAAKRYFAIQSKRQEDFDDLPDDAKRLAKRKQVAINYTELSKTAVGSGVPQKHIGIFHDKGYQGLYDGRSAKTVKRMKGLDESANLMDFIGLEELAAHDFKNTQTTRQLRERSIRTEQAAFEVHYEVGRRVRKTIEDNGNPMPEALGLEEDIRKIERRIQRQLKGKND